MTTSLAPADAAESPATLHFTHLGAAGWKITDGTTTLYLDPFFSRLRTVNVFGRSFPRPTDDPRPVYGLDDPLPSDTVTIDRHVDRADFILVSHTHFNHCMDMPYIAKKTGALVIGTESTVNVARASGVPQRQLVPVQGGEDYEFGALSVKVIPSLHSSLVIPSPYSTLDNCRYFSSATVPGDVQAPLRLRDYVEGGTLGYLIRFRGHRIVALCSMSYIEREMEGLRPNVALIPASHWRTQVYDYTGRLLRALGLPAVVIATHWDAQAEPYGASQDPQLEQAQTFVQEVTAVSPRSRVVVPRHFETIEVAP